MRIWRQRSFKFGEIRGGRAAVPAARARSKMARAQVTDRVRTEFGGDGPDPLLVSISAALYGIRFSPRYLPAVTPRRGLILSWYLVISPRHLGLPGALLWVTKRRVRSLTSLRFDQSVV